MKKPMLVTVALLGAAISPALAADVAISSGNDAILSFRVDDSSTTTDTTGASTDFEVDLGLTSQFTNSASLTLATGLGTDLGNTYGSNWSTRGDLVFEVAGVTSTANSQFIITQAGAPAPEVSSVGNAINPISQVQQTLGNTTAFTDNSKAGTLGNSTTSADSTTGSYSNESLEQGGQQYGYSKFLLSGTADQGGTFGSEAVVNGVTTLDLYAYTPVNGRSGGTPTELGVFTLTGAGTLTYAGVDAPEPSTWAMMLGGMGLFFLALRRRWISNLS